MWDFDATTPDQYPLLLHFPYFDLYRKQVVKQADLVLALHLCGDAFTDEEKARNFDYYERLTVRDSSLSACTQAVIAAEVGHLELAYDYLARGGADRPRRSRAQHPRRAAHRLAGGDMDRRGRGLRRDARPRRRLSFRPRLPAGADAGSRSACASGGGGCSSRLDTTQATYSLLDGHSLEIVHHGRKATVDAKRPTGPRDLAARRTRDAQPAGWAGSGAAGIAVVRTITARRAWRSRIAAGGQVAHRTGCSQ